MNFMPPLVNEMVNVLADSIAEHRENIKNIKLVEPGFFTFELYDKKYKAPEGIYLITTNDETNKKLAMKRFLDGDTKEIT